MAEIEAIKYFKDANRTNDMVCVLPKSNIGKCVINALEKQIPKKPKTDDRYIMYICPCCNDFIKVNHNYCTNCGQKLDWSDGE